MESDRISQAIERIEAAANRISAAGGKLASIAAQADIDVRDLTPITYMGVKQDTMFHVPGQ